MVLGTEMDGTLIAFEHLFVIVTVAGTFILTSLYTSYSACAGLLGVCSAQHDWFKSRDDGGVEDSPRSFLEIWEPAPPSRPRRLCIPGGAAPRRRCDLHVSPRSVASVVGAAAEIGETMLGGVVV